VAGPERNARVCRAVLERMLASVGALARDRRSNSDARGGYAVVELTLVGVRIELPSQTPIVLLKEREGERFLPIWIGNVEATAIAFALQGVTTQRPLTHDLMKNLLDELLVAVERVVITELKEGTFYATIELRQNGTRYSVSSRPSDAIALAVRSNTPIFAEETVLNEASILIKSDDEEREVEKFREFLDQVSPEDFQQ
jgi:bifunctional DNase/RNase